MLPLSWEASVSIWDTKVSFFQGLGTVLRSSRGSLGALHCTSNSSHFDEQPRESVWHSSERPSVWFSGCTDGGSVLPSLRCGVRPPL